MAHDEGLHLVYEGRDACGKETQSNLIAEEFRKLGIDVRAYHFPQYETLIGKLIQQDLRDEAAFCEFIPAHNEGVEWMEGRYEVSAHRHYAFQCLMLADKMSVAGKVRDFLEEGYVVVTDRWKPSGECFAPDDGVDGVWVQDTQDILEHGDINFLLDLPTEVAEARRPKLRDRYEKDRSKQERLRTAYLDYWKRRHYQGRWEVVDGDRTREEILAGTWAMVCEVAYSRAKLRGIHHFDDDRGVMISVRRDEDEIRFEWRDEIDSFDGGREYIDRIGTSTVDKVAAWCRREKRRFDGQEPLSAGDRLLKLFLGDNEHLPVSFRSVRGLTFLRQLQLMCLPRAKGSST